nr:hypothetical protein [Asgard group archaeon]
MSVGYEKTSFKITNLEKERLFNKYSNGKVKIGMNIVIVSDYNIANQLSLLFKKINEETIHKARLIILNDDYTSNNKDIVLNDKNYIEALQLIYNADFYHLGRYLPNINGVDWPTLLKPHNCVIQYFGSILRNNYDNLMKWHERTGILAITHSDPTLLRNFMGLYTFENMIDTQEIPQCEADFFSQDKPIRVCHTPTNQLIKGTNFLLEAMEQLKNEDYKVELDLIEKIPKEECLKRKAKCHILFDQ